MGIRLIDKGDKNKLTASKKKRPGLTPGVGDGDPNEKGMTKEQILAYRTGKRREGSKINI